MCCDAASPARDAAAASVRSHRRSAATVGSCHGVVAVAVRPPLSIHAPTTTRARACATPLTATGRHRPYPPANCLSTPMQSAPRRWHRIWHGSRTTTPRRKGGGGEGEGNQPGPSRTTPPPRRGSGGPARHGHAALSTMLSHARLGHSNGVDLDDGVARQARDFDRRPVNGSARATRSSAHVSPRRIVRAAP